MILLIHIQPHDISEYLLNMNLERKSEKFLPFLWITVITITIMISETDLLFFPQTSSSCLWPTAMLCSQSFLLFLFFHSHFLFLSSFSFLAIFNHFLSQTRIIKPAPLMNEYIYTFSKAIFDTQVSHSRMSAAFREVGLILSLHASLALVGRTDLPERKTFIRS